MEDLVGEFDLMTHIGDVDYVPAADVDLSQFHPLSALRELVEDLKHDAVAAA